MVLTEKEQLTLQKKAYEIRKDIIEMLTEAGSGHSAGPLGMAEVFATLYFAVMNHKPHDPFWEDRDLLVLSNGHICPVQYAAMAEAGYFPVSELKSLRKLGSRLQGHPHKSVLPGIEASSGPLGNGLPQAVGMAYADQLSGKKGRYIYTIMGDGELNEGIVWEAALFAGKNKLSNLIIIIDRNDIQIDGYTHEVMPLEPLALKWESFNFHVQDIPGNDIEEIYTAIENAKAVNYKPSVIIANTIPGKGVSFMENDPSWHGKPPNKQQAQQALEEIQSKLEEIERKLQDYS